MEAGRADTEGVVDLLEAYQRMFMRFKHEHHLLRIAVLDATPGRLEYLDDMVEGTQEPQLMFPQVHDVDLVS